MVYQYIHSIVGTVYRDMRVVSPFPQKHIETVERLCCDGSFLNHHDFGIVSYFSLDGGAEPPLVVMAKTAKKESCASLGFYAQSVGWEWDGNMLLNNMGTVFDHAFYSESEIDGYAATDASVPISVRTDDFAFPVIIDPAAAKAILYAVFSKWMRGGAPVQITVPEGADYNAYVLSAVKELYSYFPVGLRAEAGFCSYPTQTNYANSRIYIVFTPQSGVRDSISLDGSSETAIEKLINTNTGYPRLNSVVEHLCSLNREDRKAFIAGIYDCVEGLYHAQMEYNITARSYQGVGSAIELTQRTGSPAVLIPDWLKYFSEREKYPTFLQAGIEQSIARKLRGEDLREYLLNSCANLSPSDIVTRFAACNALCKTDERYASAAQKTLTALLDSSHVGDGERLELLRKNKSQLNAIVTEEMLQTVVGRIYAAQAQAFADAFKDIKNRPLETLQQIENVELKTKALLQEMERSPAAEACADVKQKINEYILSLNKTSLNLQTRIFEDKLKSLRSAEPQTTTDIDGVRGKLRELKKKIGASQVASYCDKLIEEIDFYDLSLEDRQNSSDAAYAEVKKALKATGNYFDAQKILGDNWQAVSALNEKRKTVIHQMVSSLRPSNASDYANAFEVYFEKHLDLAAIAALPLYMCSCVVQDVCTIGIKPLPLTTASSTADEMRDKAVGSIAVAGAISEKCKVTVTVNNTPYDPDILLPILSLTYSGDSTAAERLFFDLVNGGVYSASQLCAACYMVRRCDWKYRKLLESILMGKFSEAGEDEYIAAFELIFRDLKKRPAKEAPLDTMEKLKEGLKGRGDKVACKAFATFVSERKKTDKKSRLNEENKEKKPFFIPFIACAALCVALAAILIVQKLPGSDTDKPVDVTDAPAIVSITSQTPKEFFDRAFSYYSDAVKKTVLDEKNIDDYKYLYVGHQPYETMASIGEDEISWNEYFFWYSYLCAEKGIKPSDDSLESLKTDIEYVLNMCHASAQPTENTDDVKNPEQSEPKGSPAAPDTQNTVRPDIHGIPTDFETRLENAIAVARRFFGEGKSIFTGENFAGDTTDKILDTTIIQPAETEPAETEPAETEPAEMEPAEREPAETEPAETEPAETEPAETEPAETEPAETELTKSEDVSKNDGDAK